MGAVKFEIYLGAQGKHQFRMIGREGKEIAMSPGFQHKDAAMEGVRNVKEHSQFTERITKKTMDGGKLGFVLRTASRQVVLEGGPYDTQAIYDAMVSDLRLASQAAVVDKA